MPKGLPDLLEGLSDAAAAEVMALGVRSTIKSGAPLFRLGSPADCIYLVERGCIALTLPMQIRGRTEDVLIEERQAGQTLGWSALIPPHRFTLNASAPVDAEVVALPRAALLTHFTKQPDAGYVVTRNVAEVIGQRLQIFQAMWLREMQRLIEMRSAPARGLA
jgi:CRP-like cAMP-binding protein